MNASRRLSASALLLIATIGCGSIIDAVERQSSRAVVDFIELPPLPPQRRHTVSSLASAHEQRRMSLTTAPAVDVSEEVSAAAVSPAIPSSDEKRCPMYEPLFRTHGLEPVETFSYIAWRESRCDPSAHNKTRNSNGSQDYGLLQINSTWKTVTSNVCRSTYGDMTVLFSIDCNLQVARYLLDNGGLGHWSIR